MERTLKPRTCLGGHGVHQKKGSGARNVIPMFDDKYPACWYFLFCSFGTADPLRNRMCDLTEG